MKGIINILLLLCLGLFFGCSTPKALTSTTQEAAFSEEKKSESSTGSLLSKVDTTKNKGLEITYTKIEFYPPEPSGLPDKGNDNEEGKPKTSLPDMVSNLDAKPGIKQPPDQGAIKSIEQITIKATEEEAGVSETEEYNSSEKEEEATTLNSLDTVTEDKPAEDPYKWRYIFRILIIVLILLAVGYFFLRKRKVFTKIISFIKRV